MKALKALAVQPRKVETVFDEVERIQKQIVQRAYDLFLNRGALEGGDLEDWITAENEFTETIPINRPFSFSCAASLRLWPVSSFSERSVCHRSVVP